jgi:plastocyanin
MNMQRCSTIYLALLLLPMLLIASVAAAQDKKDNMKGACSNPNPASLCSAGNTCGSASTPCTVNVKRTAHSSSATPSIPGAKGNALFCVQAGTTVTWQSTAKNTGFLVDPGATTPFDPPGTITGGSEKSVSVVAKKPGCFTYHFQASNSKAIYGMSKATTGQLIVIGGQ